MEIYDSYVDNRDFNTEGISGKVSKYITEAVSYPYFCLENVPENPVPLNKMQVLPNLFGTSRVMESDLTPVTVYYKEGEKVVKLGKLVARQVNSFLRLFAGNKVTGMYDKDTVLTDDYLYVLSD